MDPYGALVAIAGAPAACSERLRPFADLSRFMRCLPFEVTDARSRVLALHASMLLLSRITRRDPMPELDGMADLLARGVAVRAPSPVVRWPIATETWSDERPDVFVESSTCDKRVERDAQSLRREIDSIRESLILEPSGLPLESVTRLAYQATRSEGLVRTSTRGLLAIEAAVERAPPGERDAAFLALAAAHRARREDAKALELARRVLASSRRTSPEELRARTIITLVITRWPKRQAFEALVALDGSIVGDARGLIAPEEAFVIAHRARALQAAGAAGQELERILAGALPRLEAADEWSNAIVDTAYDHALGKPPEAAVEWVRSFGAPETTSAASGARGRAPIELASLAARALRRGLLDHARMALAVSRATEALQGELLVRAGDLEGFAERVRSLLAKPSAAPVRIRELCLALAGPIAEAVKGKELASILIEAERAAQAPERCAGLLSVAPKGDARSVRHLGEVVVTRLRPLPEPPMPRLDAPPARLAIVFEGESGRLEVGDPFVRRRAEPEP